MANTFELIFVINGAPFTLEGNPYQPLHAAISQALAQSGNSGRPASEWIARSPSGDELNQRSRVADLGLPSGSQVYLSLTSGVGG